MSRVSPGSQPVERNMYAARMRKISDEVKTRQVEPAVAIVQVLEIAKELLNMRLSTPVSVSAPLVFNPDGTQLAPQAVWSYLYQIASPELQTVMNEGDKNMEGFANLHIEQQTKTIEESNRRRGEAKEGLVGIYSPGAIAEMERVDQTIKGPPKPKANPGKKELDYWRENFKTVTVDQEKAVWFEAALEYTLGVSKIEADRERLTVRYYQDVNKKSGSSELLKRVA